MKTETWRPSTSCVHFYSWLVAGQFTRPSCAVSPAPGQCSREGQARPTKDRHMKMVDPECILALRYTGGVSAHGGQQKPEVRVTSPSWDST